jgi:hypothetical protein
MGEGMGKDIKSKVEFRKSKVVKAYQVLEYAETKKEPLAGLYIFFR